MEERKSSRIRRTFTPGFKRDAVRLVVGEGKTPTEVARNLDIARSLLQRWVGHVTEQRDILKKALAYFADEQK